MERIERAAGVKPEGGPCVTGHAVFETAGFDHDAGPDENEGAVVGDPNGFEPRADAKAAFGNDASATARPPEAGID